MLAVYQILLFVVLLQLLLCSWNVASESCPSLYKRYSQKHTFCLPRNPACQILAKGVSSKDIEVILRLHNEYRSRVATGKESIGQLPSASNMLQMEWDKELAAVAQKHAQQCKFEHDCNECRQVKNFPVGQNIYESWSSGSGTPTPNWSSAVKLWYDEVKNFDAYLISPFDSGKARGTVGHFTQVIWAKTWKVGCGYAVYKTGGKTTQLYTCNYGPAGNMYQGEIYKQGQACSQCPKGTCCGSSCGQSPKYNGLCQVQKNERPHYPPKPGNYIYYCNFEPGTNCQISTPGGMKKWKITNTLSDSYIGVVLQGGESTMINITKTFKALPSMCFSMTFRKGPNVAGQQSRNVAKEHFYLLDMSYAMEVPLSTDTPQFMSFGMTLNYNMAMKVAISFNVPAGAPAQYFEVKDIFVKSGTC